MFTRVSTPHFTWRRVAQRGSITTWDLLLAQPPTPSHEEAIKHLLTQLADVGESHEVISQIECDDPHKAPLTIRLQQITLPTEVHS